MKTIIQKHFSAALTDVKNHIWFPKENIHGYIFRYGMSLLIGLIIVLTLVVSGGEMKTMIVAISLLGIAFASFLGNISAGILLIGFLTATFIVLVPSKQITSFTLTELLLFIIIGVFLSAIIHRSKRADLGSEFSRREELYKKEIIHLHEENQKAQKEIRVREEFLSIASHELKTPLTSMLLKLQTALHNIQHVSLANFSVQNLLSMLESAELQSKRLGRMINDLLNVSIIRTGQLELEREQCDLQEIVNEVAGRFHEKAEKDGIKINVEAPEKVTGQWDKVRIEQVLSNLISNAIKYGRGKPIDVTLKKTHSAAYFSVKDHGIGVSKQQRERIFNLFERAVGNNEYKGLGIGLFISYQIVTAHGGRIDVQSTVNKGSLFIVELPYK